MSDFWSNISAVWVFVSIGAVGFLFLLVSLIFGEIFDHADFDHDFDHGGPGLLSPRIISVFITSFGGVGAIGVTQGYGAILSSLYGVSAGVILAGLVYLFARFLYSQQATSTIATADLVGRTAQVTVAIPINGFGRVRCLIGETIIDKIARSRDNSEIQYNSLVKIEEIVGESVVVAPVDKGRD